MQPVEIKEFVLDNNKKKLAVNITTLFLLAILGGLFVAFGAYGSTVASYSIESISIKKILSGAVFPVGLILIIIGGGELFTGNTLLLLSYIDKRKGMVAPILNNWIIVYLGNLIGSLFLVTLIINSDLLNQDLLNAFVAMAQVKVELTFSQAFIRGILCNILVVMAVWMSYSAKDTISKIFAIWFPIMVFVVSGFEHSIANMFFIPMGIFLADITWSGFLFNNLVPVTLGNIVGALIICLIYYRLGLNNKIIETKKPENIAN